MTTIADGGNGFIRRNGVEKEQDIARLCGQLGFAVYLTVLFFVGWRKEVTFLLPFLIVYLAYTLFHLYWTSAVPEFSERRCLYSIPANQLFLVAIVTLGGALTAPFAWVAISDSVGSALRFGPKVGYFSAVISTTFFAIATFASPFWRISPFLSAGTLAGAFLLPVMSVALSMKLAQGKRLMEVRAADSEFAAHEAEKQLRQYKGELAHVSRMNMLEEMTSGIAHELNQPLAAILTYNQACIRMLQDDDFQKEEIVLAMNMAALQSKRAGEIISRLQTFVKKRRPQIVAVDVNDTIVDALLLIEHGLRDHEIHVLKEFDDSLPHVHADAVQMGQVVLNLIRNAIEAMNDLPSANRILTISTKRANDAVIVEIMDAGPGISQEILPKLFHPFFTTKKEGMGLGLAISQSIIESFHGTISAHNSLEQGAIFSFSLPIRNRTS